MSVRAVVGFLVRMAALCVAGAVIAVLFNALSPKGIAWVPDPNSGLRDEVLREAEIDIDRVWELVQTGEAVVVDARPVEEYDEGHVPGAISAPAQALPGSAEPLMAQLPPPDAMEGMTVVVYCQGHGCVDSMLVFDFLAGLGYRESVRILRGGWPAWQEANVPVE
ncbi:MAG TPA: rhodanese-like domain-containing protein [Phycisphaerae bacterium]|nr:rhodanese-like domain-containing protein [Phycisphaerae bacterium]